MARIAFVIGTYPPEEQRRRIDAALSFASPDVEIGIIQIEATPYVQDLSPAVMERVAPHFIAAFRRAEAEGYDAVVPLGTLDLGVDGGRSAVDIPVIAPTEAMLHVASLLGDRFGAIVYHQKQMSMLQAIVRGYGMEHKIAGWQDTGFELPDIAANAGAMRDNFVARARELIARDNCDVILAMGVTQCPVHIKAEWLTEQLGVPVVEGIGAPIRMAAMLAHLGLTHSRRRWIKSSSAR